MYQVKKQPVSWSAEKIFLSALSLAFICAALLNVRAGKTCLNWIIHETLKAANRDAVSFLSNDLVVAEADGELLSSSLSRAFEKVRLIFPEGVLVVAGGNGEIEELRGGCARLPVRYSPASLKLLEDRTGMEDLPSPCKESLVLQSAMPFALKDSEKYLLLFSSPSDFFRLSPFLTPAVLFLPIPLLFCILSFYLMHALYRGIQSQLKTLMESLSAFLAGDHTVRAETGFFSDFDEIVSTFNQMAAEYESGFNTLAEEQRRRQRIATALLHDIRTPLTAIGGAAAMIQERHFGEGKEPLLRGALTRNLKSMRSLTEGLGRLTDVDSRSAELELRPVDLVEIAAKVRTELLPQAELLGIMIELSGQSERLLAEGDDDLLRRALLNLMQNSLRFTPRGGSIRLEVAESEGVPSFAVIDSGPGISEEEETNIFEEFFRGAKQAEDSKGFGIGLAFVRRVSELHNGSVRYIRPPNGGACFRISLGQKSPDSAIEKGDATPTFDVGSMRRRGEQRFLKANSLFVSMLGFGVVSFGGTNRVEQAICLLMAVISLLTLTSTIRLSQRTMFLFQVLLSLLALGLSPFYEKGFTRAAQGMVLGSLIIPIALVLGRAAVILPPVVALIAANFHTMRTGPLILGFVSGLLLSIYPLLLDFERRARRIAGRIQGIPFFFLTLGVAFQSAGLYLLSARIALGVPHNEVAERASNIGRWLSSASCENPLEQCAAELGQLSRMSAFYISDAADQRIYSTDSLEHLNRAPELAAIASFRASRAPWLLPQVYRLFLQVPAWSGFHFAEHANQSPVLTYAFWAVVSLSLIFYLPGRIVTSGMRRDFAKLLEGVERYRKGEFERGIDVSSEGVLGMLATSLNRIGHEVPRLRAQLAGEAKARAVLIGDLNRVLENGLNKINRHIRADGTLMSAGLVIQECHHQQRLLHRVLTSFRTQGRNVPEAKEIVPLCELLSELEEWKATLLSAATLSLDIPEEEVFVESNPDELLELLQIVIREFLLIAGANELVAVAISATGERAEIALSIEGPEGLPRKRQPDEQNDLRQLFALFGLAVEVSQNGTADLRVRITFDRASPDVTAVHSS